MWEGLLPTEPVRFAEDFLWGTGSSAFQAEGGDVPNDWVAHARAGRVPPNPGNGFWERAEEDFALVASLGFRHYRLSLEWSRVEPEPGRFDEAALDRYRRMCDGARAAGVTPWVNFFHFTHPTWLASLGGLEAQAGRDAFLRYVERAARALRGCARDFHTQNESMVYVLIGYLTGAFPPFVSDRERAWSMSRHVLWLHARAHGILKELQPDCRVVPIEVYLDVQPADPGDAGQREAASRFDAWYHGTLLRALATGVVALPGREPEEIAGLRGAADAYGLNYYNSTGIGLAHGSRYADLPDPPIDAMGRAVNPAGLERGLARVAEALPGLPILITENGCPTRDEDFRIRYVAAHLAALGRARERGIPVGGYFHWTAVDNYEWLEGFSDARFGLIGFDPRTMERRVKPSGLWMRDLIARGVLEPGQI